MRYLISGASGLVGSYLSEHLQQAGHQVEQLARVQGAQHFWQPEQGLIQLAHQDFDVVIHLSGESIAQGRWNRAKKQRIMASRKQSTALLAQTIAAFDKPPRCFVCASGVGYYGAESDDLLTEQSPKGQGFLALVAQEWEAACEPARAAGIRVINTRFGMVASTRGGGLAQMMLPFKLGLGGPIGSGQQYMPWLSLPELANIIDFCIANEALSGPLNCVSPEPVSNARFAQALATALGRPCKFPMPEFMVRLGFGEVADAVLLSSLKIKPAALEAAGYQFIHGDIDKALGDLIEFKL